ncbi:MAG: BREX-1 system adenine-specific DNA-methyltransferase PglX, partial [Slackia piriformis]|nr:BREX-1 system adenine-specific DNA-methyltransferase PglX [Slackia piriformis]
KAVQKDIAPATQLFTPNWIVRYMVENSLGRLWMLNNPGSGLRERMAYYIEPDGDHEDFIRVAGPEDITFCDPACGSGHILVYAFSLLFEMYLEHGYREREIPELILTKNLSGLEIDDRAAQIASLALVMCAREHDRRFFARDVAIDVHVVKPVVFGKEKNGEEVRPVPRALEKRKDLIEALTYLDEIGSLFAPSAFDMAALDEALAEIPEGDMFAQDVREHLELAKGQCEALSRTFDVVVANPPYMGSSKFNPFMNKWMKKNYPDEKSDLCFAFINRICSMKKHGGEVGIAATNSWMFLSSSEASRLKVLGTNEITSLVQLSVHGFKGIAAQVFAFTLIDKQVNGYRGGYVRLDDFDHHSLQEGKTLEAIENPECGWFYRADASTFHDIPGSPIAYWASEAIIRAFKTMDSLGTWLTTREGMATANNDQFVRSWWESPLKAIGFGIPDQETAMLSGKKWFPYQKGGEYRKWYGNNDLVVNWENDGSDIRSNIDEKT